MKMFFIQKKQKVLGKKVIGDFCEQIGSPPINSSNLDNHREKNKVHKSHKYSKPRKKQKEKGFRKTSNEDVLYSKKKQKVLGKKVIGDFCEQIGSPPINSSNLDNHREKNKVHKSHKYSKPRKKQKEKGFRKTSNEDVLYSKKNKRYLERKLLEIFVNKLVHLQLTLVISIIIEKRIRFINLINILNLEKSKKKKGLEKHLMKMFFIQKKQKVLGKKVIGDFCEQIGSPPINSSNLDNHREKNKVHKSHKYSKPRKKQKEKGFRKTSNEDVLYSKKKNKRYLERKLLEIFVNKLVHLQLTLVISIIIEKRIRFINLINILNLEKSKKKKGLEKHLMKMFFIQKKQKVLGKKVIGDFCEQIGSPPINSSNLDNHREKNKVHKSHKYSKPRKKQKEKGFRKTSNEDVLYSKKNKRYLERKLLEFFVNKLVHLQLTLVISIIIEKRIRFINLINILNLEKSKKKKGGLEKHLMKMFFIQKKQKVLGKKVIGDFCEQIGSPPINSSNLDNHREKNKVHKSHKYSKPRKKQKQKGFRKTSNEDVLYSKKTKGTWKESYWRFL
ncbi:uncharacterized protein LOC121770764 isoform X2 [Salvia splendens]|uniref:uncharacterized protein LOC121770764 isoform X2 n=1 Tax=Salvia splendens TaxID=180675 RepID=UPI001C255BBE|nr:uncharacterized protein LOC121770764 isoform X2 [Salvia splendens]